MNVSSVSRRIFSYSVIFVLALLASTCAFKEMGFTILSDEVGGLDKGSPVFLDSTEIGRVTGMEARDGKTAVKVHIFGEYKDRIKEKSAFYILGSGDETHVQIQVIDEDSPNLKSDITVEGSPEYMYWMREGARKIEEWMGEGMEKTREFLESDEWREFKEKIGKEIDRARSEGEEEFKRQLPRLKEEARKFYKEAQELGEKTGKRAKAYIDSLLKKMEEENKESDK